MKITDNKIKNVLIVGVSSAIGKSLFEIYINKGFRVYATYNKNKLESSIKNACKESLSIDLSDQYGIERLLEFAETTKPTNIIYLPGFIDNLDLYDNSLSSIHKSFNINYFAYLLLISKTYKYMKSIGYGRYLSLSSIGSKYGGASKSLNYTISKRSLEYFPSEYKRLAEFNIFFNNIICGVTNSSILKDKKNIDLNARVLKIPVKRMARPSEIALNCYRLCSYENTFQTLSNTTIAGGE